MVMNRYPHGQLHEQIPLSGVGYKPFGPVSGYSFGNRQALTREHDLDYQITGIVSPALELHFGRDPVGNIDSLSAGSGSEPPVEQYAYDALYRLEAVLSDTGSSIESYDYDLVGNRLSKTVDAGTEPYQYASTSHHLIEVGGSERAYDAVGNLLSDQKGQTSFTYGDHDRMSEFSSDRLEASYRYNGRGERTYKAVRKGRSTQQVYYVYDESGRLLSELTYADGGYFLSVRREYVYLEDLPVAVLDYDSGLSVYYIHADHLGTPRAATDSGGTKRWAWPFQSNPFGELAPDEDPEGSGEKFTLNLRFPGQYYDSDSGLHYNYFRDYEPQTGRYVQSDPIGIAAGVNMFDYVGSSPIVYSDPLGLKVWSCKSPMGCNPGEQISRNSFWYHECLSVTNQDGSISCNSTTAAGDGASDFFRSDGRATSERKDYYHQDSCTIVDGDDSRCAEICILSTWSHSRPRYSLLGPHGMNCQDYSRELLSRCQRECSR